MNCPFFRHVSWLNHWFKSVKSTISIHFMLKISSVQTISWLNNWYSCLEFLGDTSKSPRHHPFSPVPHPFRAVARASSSGSIHQGLCEAHKSLTKSSQALARARSWPQNWDDFFWIITISISHNDPIMIIYINNIDNHSWIIIYYIVTIRFYWYIITISTTLGERIINIIGYWSYLQLLIMIHNLLDIDMMIY